MSREIRCFDDMDLFGSEVSDNFEDLIQDLYHRLIEPPGSNIDDLSRGLGLEDMLSGPVDSALEKRIEAELEKDDRVTRALATVTQFDLSSFRIDIQIVANEVNLGLVLQSDSAGNIIRVVS